MRNSNSGKFISLYDLNLTEDESLDLFWDLRCAFESRYPNNMVDASDAYGITVFPFARGEEFPNEFIVFNYAVGKFNENPALLNCDGSSEMFVLKDDILVKTTL